MWLCFFFWISIFWKVEKICCQKILWNKQFFSLILWCFRRTAVLRIPSRNTHAFRHWHPQALPLHNATHIFYCTDTQTKKCFFTTTSFLKALSGATTPSPPHICTEAHMHKQKYFFHCPQSYYLESTPYSSIDIATFFSLNILCWNLFFTSKLLSNSKSILY